MKNFKRNTIVALSCAAGLMIGMTNAYAQEKVTIGVFNSAGVKVIANLIKIVIEENNILGAGSIILINTEKNCSYLTSTTPKVKIDNRFIMNLI